MDKTMGRYEYMFLIPRGGHGQGAILAVVDNVGLMRVTKRMAAHWNRPFLSPNLCYVVK
jgi:hypothetical protein